MTSKQIISTIASMAKDNEKMTESILGGHIVKECVKLNEKQFIYKEVKPLIDSCSFLVKQIELCEDQVNVFAKKLTDMQEHNKNNNAFPYEQQEFNIVKSMRDDSQRQKELFTKQLIEAIEKL